MGNGTTKPVIFISYSHKDEPKDGPDDEKWLSYVQYHLAPAVKSALFELWVDEDMPGGYRWKAQAQRVRCLCSARLTQFPRIGLRHRCRGEDDYGAAEEGRRAVVSDRAQAVRDQDRTVADGTQPATAQWRVAVGSRTGWLRS